LFEENSFENTDVNKLPIGECFFYYNKIRIN
jgi:hypothetical protein